MPPAVPPSDAGPTCSGGGAGPPGMLPSQSGPLALLHAAAGCRAWDTLVAAHGPDPYWVGPFEDGITELGIRAATWDVAENDGGNRADLMLEDWRARGRPRVTSPYPGRWPR